MTSNTVCCEQEREECAHQQQEPDLITALPLQTQQKLQQNYPCYEQERKMCTSSQRALALFAQELLKKIFVVDRTLRGLEYFHALNIEVGMSFIKAHLVKPTQQRQDVSVLLLNCGHALMINFKVHVKRNLIFCRTEKRVENKLWCMETRMPC